MPTNYLDVIQAAYYGECRKYTQAALGGRHRKRAAAEARERRLRRAYFFATGKRRYWRRIGL